MYCSCSVFLNLPCKNVSNEMSKWCVSNQQKISIAKFIIRTIPGKLIMSKRTLNHFLIYGSVAYGRAQHHHITFFACKDSTCYYAQTPNLPLDVIIMIISSHIAIKIYIDLWFLLCRHKLFQLLSSYGWLLPQFRGKCMISFYYSVPR